MHDFKETIKWLGIALLCFAILASASLIWKATFGVTDADLNTNIFEQSKSYRHGTTQAIARAYQEYHDSETTEDEKEAIKNILKANYPDFEASNINNLTIRNFFIKARGY